VDVLADRGQERGDYVRVASLEDGLTRRWVFFTDRTEALEAAGLSE
jgi:hypothetical protein